jgi:hypothetical protein
MFISDPVKPSELQGRGASLRSVNRVGMPNRTSLAGRTWAPAVTKLALEVAGPVRRSLSTAAATDAPPRSDGATASSPARVAGVATSSQPAPYPKDPIGTFYISKSIQ